jgi:hypothetical protein
MAGAATEADETLRPMTQAIPDGGGVASRLSVLSQGSDDAGGIGIEHENIAPDHRIEGFSLLDRVQPRQAKRDVAFAELVDPISGGGDLRRRAIDSYDEPIIADKLSKKERCIAGSAPHVQDPHAFRNSSIVIELESERVHEFGLPFQALQLPVGVPKVKSRLDLVVRDLGSQSLKNIAEPVHVYSLGSASRLTRNPRRPQRPRNPSRRAFRSSFYRSPISEATRSRSISSTGSRRASRPTSQGYEARSWSPATAFTYKGKPIDVKKLGRDLNVRYVVEGSIQRSASDVRGRTRKAQL